MFNFNHLYYFYVFVTEGSVVRAAKKLSISQPALSAQLRQLERRVGQRLLEREGRRLVPTAKGETVYMFARQMFTLAEELSARLSGKKARAPTAPRLRLGLSDQMHLPWLARALAATDASSRPFLELRAGTHERLQKDLLSQGLDAVLTHQPISGEGAEPVAQIQLPVMLAVPAQSKKGGNKNTLDRMLSQSPLAFLRTIEFPLAVPGAGTRLRSETDLFFAKIKTSPRVVLEAEPVAWAAESVRAGLAASLLPAPFVKEAIETGEIKLYGPRGGFWKHSVWLVARKSYPEAQMLERLVRQLYKFI